MLFALFIGVLVTVCFREDVSLVSKTYYQDELAHQKKIDQQRNAEELDVKPEIKLSEAGIDVYFPMFSKLEKGKLKLMRPSDQRLDQSFQITTSSDSIQRFTLSVWSSGLYRASMEWTMEGKEYYVEKVLVK